MRARTAPRTESQPGRPIRSRMDLVSTPGPGRLALAAILACTSAGCALAPAPTTPKPQAAPPDAAQAAPDSPKTAPGDKPAAVAVTGHEAMPPCHGLEWSPLDEPKAMLDGRLRVRADRFFDYQNSSDRFEEKPEKTTFEREVDGGGKFMIQAMETFLKPPTDLERVAREELLRELPTRQDLHLDTEPFPPTEGLRGLLLLTRNGGLPMGRRRDWDGNPMGYHRLLARALVSTDEHALILVDVLLRHADDTPAPAGCIAHARRLLRTLTFGGRLLNTGPETVGEGEPTIHKPAGFVARFADSREGHPIWSLLPLVDYGSLDHAILVSYNSVLLATPYPAQEKVSGRIYGQSVEWTLSEHKGRGPFLLHAETNLRVVDERYIWLYVTARDRDRLERTRKLAETLLHVEKDKEP